MDKYITDGLLLLLAVLLLLLLLRNKKLKNEIAKSKKLEQELENEHYKFKTLFDLAPILIDAFDEKGKCTIWNKECEQVFGWTIDEINMHENTIALFYPDPEVQKEVINTVLYKPDKVFREWHPITKDGKELTTMWANVNLPNGEIINVGYDITEDKKREEVLEALNNELHQMVDIELEKSRKKDKQLMEQLKLAQMGEMIDMIAHQWRQPLTAISATTNNLIFKLNMEDVDRKFFLQEMSLISEYTKHLSETIDDFRSFLQERDTKEPTVLEDIVRDVLKIVRPLMERSHITLSTHFNPQKGSVDVYANDVKHALLNLLKNAEEVLTERNVEAPQIIVRTKKDGNRVIVSVEDNAGGVPKDISDKIFNPYFSTRLDKNGTGLGLYMVKLIMHEKHNGSLEFHNTEKGAVFEMTFSESESKG